jgi:hypothetical protein
MISKLKKGLQTARPIGALAAAAIFLNLLLNVSFTAPPSAPAGLLKIAPEILIILIAVCLWATLRLPGGKPLLVILTLTIVFLRLFRIADGLVPMYFNRPFNLYLDGRFLPDLIFLLYSTLPFWLFSAGCAAAAAGLGLAVWGIWRALRAFYGFFARPRRRRFLAAAAVASVALLCGLNLWQNRTGTGIWAPLTVGRVAAEIDFILHLSDAADRHRAAFEAAVHRAAQYPDPLSKLNGSDVYVFFIESYGHTIFADPRHAARIVPALRAAEGRLRGQGYAMASNFLKSPAYGGTSWLAHGSLASGVAVTSQLRYDHLLTSRVQPIAQYFNRAGYRTVSVMPGTLWPWPAGEFYRFQKKYYAFDFGYRGPEFGWAPMPDQYVVDYIVRSEIQSQRRRQPLFIEFVLVSSHAPFNRQPRYLADWTRIGDGAIYHDMEPLKFPVTWPDLANAAPAYMAALTYDWRVLAEFCAALIPREALVIILGDHQPNLKITGDGQPWSVPVHVISRRPDFIEPFVQSGYQPGLIPDQPLPHRGIESLLWDLLKAFS